MLVRRHPRALRSLSVILGAVAAATGVLALSIVPAGAATPDAFRAAPSPADTGQPDAPPRSLAVSIPSEPVQLPPGGTTTIPLRVINPGDRPVTVTITGRQLHFEDNGHLRIGTTADPKWNDRVEYPQGPQVVPARGFINAPVTVHMPDTAAPDLYFIGFLVTPATVGDQRVQVVNQIGSYLTIDVPGPRERKLTASIDLPVSLHIPGFHIGNDLRGEVIVSNIGRSAVRYWGEVQTNPSPGGTPAQKRIDKTLLPTGLHRSHALVAQPAWPIGFIDTTVHIVYPGTTEASSKEVVLHQRTLVVSPSILIAAALLLVATAGYLYRHKRNRHQELATKRRQARAQAIRVSST